MTLQQILYVLTVAECGSMNKAAEKLFIVQPTLTKAIHDLEEEIGLEIFLRSHRGIIPTPEGIDFLSQVRQLYSQYDSLIEKYVEKSDYKRKFGVSTQHYSFAVKAFIEMARHYDVNQFDFAIRETRTKDVISDVGKLKSEVGILYLCDSNRRPLLKLFRENELEFHSLITCSACVYLWKGHPLAKEPSIGLSELTPYPCLAFDQGDDNPFYYVEEILSENSFPRKILATDRATMLNLMKGMNGYTLCSGIISEEQNLDDFTVVPFREDEENTNSIMEIGYITKQKSELSRMGKEYIEEVKKILNAIR